MPLRPPLGLNQLQYLLNTCCDNLLTGLPISTLVPQLTLLHVAARAILLKSKSAHGTFLL